MNTQKLNSAIAEFTKKKSQMQHIMRKTGRSKFEFCLERKNEM